jgi:hypothetical protein
MQKALEKQVMQLLSSVTSDKDKYSKAQENIQGLHDQIKIYNQKFQGY